MKVLRTVIYKGKLYFERDDILEYLREFASTEETDVRNRLQEAIDNLNGPFPGVTQDFSLLKG
jgi:hypothetical protein